MIFLRCPECRKKGIYPAPASDGDGYRCRYGCGFWAYRNGKLDAIDKAHLWALARVNPGVEVQGAPAQNPGWPEYLGEPDEWMKQYVEHKEKAQ